MPSGASMTTQRSALVNKNDPNSVSCNAAGGLFDGHQSCR